MPRAAKRPCTYPGCGLLTDTGRCERHRIAERKAQDARRGNSSERGYGSRWQKARASFLRSHPLCAEHERQGQVVIATVVDHIEPHRGDQAKFWSTANWQPLCKACHDAKTAREDGGFGRRVGAGQISSPPTR